MACGRACLMCVGVCTQERQCSVLCGCGREVRGRWGERARVCVCGFGRSDHWSNGVILTRGQIAVRERGRSLSPPLSPLLPQSEKTLYLAN